MLNNSLQRIHFFVFFDFLFCFVSLLLLLLLLLLYYCVFVAMIFFVKLCGTVLPLQYGPKNETSNIFVRTTGGDAEYAAYVPHLKRPPLSAVALGLCHHICLTDCSQHRSFFWGHLWASFMSLAIFLFLLWSRRIGEDDRIYKLSKYWNVFGCVFWLIVHISRLTAFYGW